LKHDLRSLYSATGLGIALFTVLSVGTLSLQQRIVAIAHEARNQVLPEVQTRLRMVRNIELLRGYGNVAYRTRDPQVRQEAGFLSILLTAHPSAKADPATLPLLREANSSVQSIVKGQIASANWPDIDRRLAIHADRMSIAAETMTSNQALQIEVAAARTRNFALAQALLFLIGSVAMVAWSRALSHRMKAKNQYFNELSHDFRQRVHNVELSLGAAAQEQVHRMSVGLAGTQELVGDLQRYLDNFLDVARMETVTVKPLIAEFTVSHLFQQLALQTEDIAEHRGVVLRFRHSPLILCSDERWLRRAMENLVVNAVKFARSKVLVAARRRADGIHLLVFDDGRGISCTSALQTADHGFGLGLTIAKRTIRMLSGRLDIRSVPERGTVVRVRLPLGR
jgi:signal transduction histidine kinase